MDHRKVDTDKRERLIATLAASTQRPLEEVRTIFAQEYTRLEAGAKVRTHLDALVVSSVRSKLRRKQAPVHRAAESIAANARALPATRSQLRAT
jgi:hypothetical protein